MQYPYEPYVFTKLRPVYRQRTGKELPEGHIEKFGRLALEVKRGKSAWD